MASKVRTYRANLEKSRVGMSPEQIRAAKCGRRRSAHEAIRNENYFKEQDRKRLTPEQQLAKLDARLGYNVGAKRERAKLLKAAGLVPYTTPYGTQKGYANDATN